MTHTDYTLWMSLALDGMLAPDEERALHIHLDICPACHAMWQTWASLDRQLRAVPVVAPAPGFVARVEARQRARDLRRRGAIGGLLLLSGAISIWSALSLSVALVCVWWLANHLPVFIPLMRFVTAAIDAITIWFKLARMLGESLVALSAQPIVAAYAIVVLILAMVWMRVVIWQRPKTSQVITYVLS
jgi:anti-sigma factor RsiW